jgi:hypothetical protein
MRRKLGDEALRQRLEAVVLFGLGFRLRRTGANGDDGTLDRTVRLVGDGGLDIVILDRLERRLILSTYIAPLDPEIAVAVDANEHAGAGNLGGIIDKRTSVECLQRGLELADSLVDLLRQLVGLGIFLLELIKLRAQYLAGRTLLVGELDALTMEFA